MASTHNDFVRTQPTTSAHKLSIAKGILGDGGDDTQNKGKGQGAPKGVDIWAPKFKHMRITSAENGYTVEHTKESKHVKTAKGASTGHGPHDIGEPTQISKTYLIGKDHPAHKHLSDMCDAMGCDDDD